jgi:hypothetical protein
LGAIEVLSTMLSSICIWIGGCVVRRLRPRIPATAPAAVAFLLFQGWWMILNAQYTYDRIHFQFVPVPCLWRNGPGVVDRVDSLPAMIRITGLLASFALSVISSSARNGAPGFGGRSASRVHPSRSTAWRSA